MFFLAITIITLLFLTAISLGVFLSKPDESSVVLVFNKPKVNIDMGVFDLDQFKDLQEFSEMKIQFSYKAVDNKKKPQTGFVSASSEDEARASLKAQGLTVSEIKEVETGRDNPFIPYYTVTAPAKKK